MTEEEFEARAAEIFNRFDNDVAGLEWGQQCVIIERIAGSFILGNVEPSAWLTAVADLADNMKETLLAVQAARGPKDDDAEVDQIAGIAGNITERLLLVTDGFCQTCVVTILECIAGNVIEQTFAPDDRHSVVDDIAASLKENIRTTDEEEDNTFAGMPIQGSA